MIWVPIFFLLLPMILVPQRCRYFLNQFFLFLVTPFRDLAALCGNYITNFTANCRKLLHTVGIKSHYFIRSIGSLMISVVTIICILADLDMIILSLDAMGLGSGKASVFTSLGINPADAMGIALIGSAVVWGAFLLDIFKITTWVPECFIENGVFRKIILFSGISMLFLATIALTGLASYRFNSINFNEVEMENFMNLNSDSSEVALMATEKSGLVHFVFIFISISTLLTSIIGAILLPAAFIVIMCILMGILICPVAICFFIGNLFDRLITLLFNITLAAFNIIIGVFNGLGQGLRKALKVDDNTEDIPEGTQDQNTNQQFIPSREVERTEIRERNRAVPAQNPEVINVQPITENDEASQQRIGNNEDLPFEESQGFDESGFNPLEA